MRKSIYEGPYFIILSKIITCLKHCFPNMHGHGMIEGEMPLLYELHPSQLQVLFWSDGDFKRIQILIGNPYLILVKDFVKPAHLKLPTMTIENTVPLELFCTREVPIWNGLKATTKYSVSIIMNMLHVGPTQVIGRQRRELHLPVPTCNPSWFSLTILIPRNWVTVLQIVKILFECFWVIQIDSS